jgi:hypothetical protein
MAAPKCNVLTFGSPEANLKIWPWLFSGYHEIAFFNLTYPLRCLRVPQVEDQWPNEFNVRMNKVMLRAVQSLVAVFLRFPELKRRFFIRGENSGT